MKKVDISSWSELSQQIEKFASGGWIFRGEPKDKFELKPKAGRESKEIGSARKVPYKVADEIAALELFKRQARPYINYSPSTDIEWLAIAQHHGMHTRLLDWSESFLVAAYFATVNAGANSHNGVIYAINNLHHIEKDTETNPFNLTKVGIYRPPHITPRIPAQRSVFTVHNRPTETYTSQNLLKLVISNHACAFIKKILDSCAINESSLFPDLDGLSRYIGWRYKWGKFG